MLRGLGMMGQVKGVLDGGGINRSLDTGSIMAGRGPIRRQKTGLRKQRVPRLLWQVELSLGREKCEV